MSVKARSAAILLPVRRFVQPDDVTCGPTCLAKVYEYYGYRRSLPAVIAETPRNPDGGTLAVDLGVSALKNGFRPTIYPFGLRIFDPTWHRLDRAALIGKLRLRERTAASAKLRRAVASFVQFLELGGRVRFRDPSPGLIVRRLRRGDPVLTGISATYLYGTPREHDDRYDDVRGTSAGHFVVVHGYHPARRRFVVADPFRNVPFSHTGRYTVRADRLMAAILLGDATYDAVVLVLGPRVRIGRT